jgi:1-acyl-sn-glycerol-3-phosphate acyltransferase
LIRALIAVAFWTLYVPIAALIGFPYTLVTRDIDFLWKLGMWGARGGVWLSGVRTRVVGLERLDPMQPYIFMSNHVSNIDPPIIVPLLGRRMSILAKKELFSIPVLGTALKLANLVPVDRRNRDAAIDSVHRAVAVLDSGLSMLVYPEGTRSHDGKLRQFKNGPFHMAMESGVAVAPLTILGAYEIWPKGEFAIHPGTATLIVHDPIDPKNFADRDELMSAVRASVESGLPEKYRTIASSS